MLPMLTWSRRPSRAGRILSIDQAAARHLPGVCEILTYENVGKKVKAGKPLLEGGYMAHAVAPLASPRIYFAGQITAVVIADTFEQAQAGRRGDRIPLQGRQKFRFAQQPRCQRGQSQGRLARPN